MHWTPNRVTLLRVVVGFAAVCLFGRGPWLNLAAVVLTVASIALDALDGYLARRKNLATPVGAQIDILGDRMIENVYFTYLPSSEWFRFGFRYFFSPAAPPRIFFAAWPCAPAIPAGAPTPCCKPGGAVPWSLRVGAAAFTPP
jgi:phosphatidylserine synthase